MTSFTSAGFEFVLWLCETGRCLNAIGCESGYWLAEDVGCSFCCTPPMIQKVIISFRCTCTRRRKSINSGEMWRVRSATIFASLLPVALHVRACAVAFPNPVCLDRGCYVTLTIHLQHYGRPISPFITRGEKRTQAQQSCPSWDKFDGK